MKWIKSVLGIVLAIAGLGAVAGSVFSLVNLTDDTSVEFTLIEVVSTGTYTVTENTSIALWDIYNDNYDLDSYTLNTTTYDTYNMEFVSGTPERLRFIIEPNTDEFFQIGNTDQVTFGAISVKIGDVISLNFSKPVLNTTSVLLITLIPLAFVGGLLVYIQYRKQD